MEHPPYHVGGVAGEGVPKFIFSSVPHIREDGTTHGIPRVTPSHLVTVP